MKKTHLFVLMLLIGAFTNLPAQLDVRQRSFGDMTLTSVAADAEGYYVIAFTEREEMKDYSIKTYMTPSLIHYDTQFSEQWRITFRETRSQELSEIKLVGDKLLLHGTSRPTGDRCQAWVLCLDKNGQALWDKKFAYPGYHSVEGFDIYPLPDGGYILRSIAYRLFSSPGTPMLSKLNARGELEWQKLYGTQYTYSIINNCTITQDGNLVMVGNIYPDKTWFAKEVSKAWMQKINLKGRGEVIWEKQYIFDEFSAFNDVVELASGQMGIAGNAGPSVSVPSNLLLVTDANGNELGKEVWKTKEVARLNQIVQDPQTGNYFVSGYTKASRRQDKWEVQMQSLDPSFIRTGEVIVEVEAFRIKDPCPAPDGGIALCAGNSLLLFR